MASITINGNQVELPKFTLALAERFAEVGKTSDIGPKAKMMHGIVVDAIGKEKADELLDGSSVDDVDLVALSNLYTVIDGAYSDALSEEQGKRMQKNADEARELFDTVNKAMSAVDYINKNGQKNAKGNRQVFASA